MARFFLPHCIESSTFQPGGLGLVSPRVRPSQPADWTRFLSALAGPTWRQRLIACMHAALHGRHRRFCHAGRRRRDRRVNATGGLGSSVPQIRRSPSTTVAQTKDEVCVYNYIIYIYTFQRIRNLIKNGH